MVRLFILAACNLLFLSINNQNVNIDFCTESNERAEKTIKFFLEWEDNEMIDFRQEAGVSNLNFEEVILVNSQNECQMLTNFIHQNFEEMGESDLEFTKHYYKSQNNFFIVYVRRVMVLEPTPLIILDSNLQLKGNFGI